MKASAVGISGPPLFLRPTFFLVCVNFQANDLPVLLDTQCCFVAPADWLTVVLRRVQNLHFHRLLLLEGYHGFSRTEDVWNFHGLTDRVLTKICMDSEGRGPHFRHGSSVQQNQYDIFERANCSVLPKPVLK